MESIQNLKKRIKSVTNINKITKAMELVAATKMRKAQEIALASRPYAFTALDLLANISLIEKELPELLHEREIKAVLFVVIASDKGLAGAFNSALFRKFEKHTKKHLEEYKNEEHLFVAVGEKAFQYLSRKQLSVVQKFTNFGDFTESNQVHPLTDFMVKGYLEKKWDRVIIISTHFHSALKQESMVKKVLPIDYADLKETIKEILPENGRFAEMIKEQDINFNERLENINEYVIEPSPEIVLEKLVEHLFFMQVYHLILEANASEHSARRLAMKTASDNAQDLKEKLNLQYNKSRQAGITNQIIEITAGSEAQQ